MGSGNVKRSAAQKLEERKKVLKTKLNRVKSERVPKLADSSEESEYETPSLIKEVEAIRNFKVLKIQFQK